MPSKSFGRRVHLESECFASLHRCGVHFCRTFCHIKRRWCRAFLTRVQPFVWWRIGPAMSFWVHNRSQYWSEFDALVDSIEEHNLSAVFSIGYSDWWWSANDADPSHTLNETLNDQVLNRSSVSFTYMTTYIRELVDRYRDRHCVLLWELGNELNLMVDLPPPVWFCTSRVQCDLCEEHAHLTFRRAVSL